MLQKPCNAIQDWIQMLQGIHNYIKKKKNYGMKTTDLTYMSHKMETFIYSIFFSPLSIQ